MSYISVLYLWAEPGSVLFIGDAQLTFNTNDLCYPHSLHILYLIQMYRVGVDQTM